MFLEEPKALFIPLHQTDTTTTSCARNANHGTESCIGSNVKPSDPDCEDCATSSFTT